MPQYFNSTAAFPMKTKKRVYASGGRARSTYASGGRATKQLGGPMSTARRDMTHGYYQPDMGMQGGRMFRGGGAVKKRGSIGVALKKGGSANWIQDVNKSIKKRGTKGKCTPITKPGCTGRAKALAKTFKKMARKRKG
jgi:hypothetical protein